MNLHISDTCILKGKKYFLLNLKYNDLFGPGSFGIEQETLLGDYPPRIYATYIFQRKQLFLKELIYKKLNVTLRPDIYSTKLASDDQFEIMEIWEGLKISENLLLSRNIVKGLHNAANSENPIAFKTVLDITLNNGRIVDIEDCSQTYEQMRSAIKEDALEI